MNILFVCTGNTCRSPMAEALFKSAAAEKNLDVSVKSAGLFAPENGKASLYAVEALFENGAYSEALGGAILLSFGLKLLLPI
ncbi:hypothetical protein DT075_07540 [Bacillus licheniformis]|nr:hypothetical protein DT075_07540 [Bacillus licheniformis]